MRVGDPGDFLSVDGGGDQEHRQAAVDANAEVAAKISNPVPNGYYPVYTDVPRGNADVAEVTSLEGAVRAWLGLDPQHKTPATLTAERPVLIDSVSPTSFAGDGISVLAELFPAPSAVASA